MKRLSILTLAAILIMAGVAGAGETTRWINVHVTEPDDGTNVEVHLPLDVVLTIIDGIKVDNFDAGKIDLEIDDVDIDWPKIFDAVKSAPDGKFITVNSLDADVKVSKEQGTILIHVEEKLHGNEVVDVRIPASLINGVFIDDGNRIDVKALLQGLADLPTGDIVRVDAEDAQVRVWVE